MLLLQQEQHEAKNDLCVQNVNVKQKNIVN